VEYYSTNKKSPSVDFREATMRGLAPDKGLYFPEKIPSLSGSFIEGLKSMSNEQIAFEVIAPFVGTSIPAEQLAAIVSETVDFNMPLVKVHDGIYSLELFHGPTLAFKDVGARFMSRCLAYFLSEEKRRLTVLVATSGDTGGAVADGFFGQPNLDVVILFPSGKVSPIQEQQLTTYGGNVTALEIDGTFDDCQQMVKHAFADEEVNNHKFLTSANSINVARWLPQQFYYFFALKQWDDLSHPPVISVPSGNFGNICAGMLAAYAGLPVCKFIAACNANDVIPRYLQTDEYKPRPAISTISNAMDVGAPGNFIRIEELYRHYLPEIKKHLLATSISDEETRECISHLYQSTKYLLDPHASVAYCALKQYLDENPDDCGIFLSTAHAVKFPTVVEECIREKIDPPARVKEILEKQKSSVKMPASYSILKEYLLG
jgi:threonine synthase